MERILATFPRFVGAGFGSLTTETFCRAFSAVFGARVSKSVFSGTAVCDCVVANQERNGHIFVRETPDEIFRRLRQVRDGERRPLVGTAWRRRQLWRGDELLVPNQ